MRRTGPENPVNVLRRAIDLVGFAPLAHRPPLPRRWWVYCTVAYLAPSLLLQFVTPADAPYRDLVWLATLVPAFLLSLHYGLRGALAGLLMGTVLFTAVQLLVAMNLDAEDWRITVPIYVAYGAIAISVGWLSEQLHLFYGRAIEGERVAAISELAIAIRHEVNNALATILAAGQLLEQDARTPEDRELLRSIMEMTRRIHDSLDRLVTLAHAPTTDYVEGVRMIDLDRVHQLERPDRERE
jgi:signal transduction histidine kinase